MSTLLPWAKALPWRPGRARISRAFDVQGARRILNEAYHDGRGDFFIAAPAVSPLIMMSVLISFVISSSRNPVPHNRSYVALPPWDESLLSCHYLFRVLDLKLRRCACAPTVNEVKSSPYSPGELCFPQIDFGLFLKHAAVSG